VSVEDWWELDTYSRLTKTWDIYSPETQSLILENIKLDLKRRIAAEAEFIEIEPDEPPEPEDESRYQEELRNELAHSYSRLNCSERKQGRTDGELRDSSVELVEGLDPDIADVSADLTGDEDDDELWRFGSAIIFCYKFGRNLFLFSFFFFFIYIYIFVYVR
jgi:hypothetical protein